MTLPRVQAGQVSSSDSSNLWIYAGWNGHSQSAPHCRAGQQSEGLHAGRHQGGWCWSIDSTFYRVRQPSRECTAGRRPRLYILPPREWRPHPCPRAGVAAGGCCGRGFPPALTPDTRTVCSAPYVASQTPLSLFSPSPPSLPHLVVGLLSTVIPPLTVCCVSAIVRPQRVCRNVVQRSAQCRPPSQRGGLPQWHG